MNPTFLHDWWDARNAVMRRGTDIERGHEPRPAIVFDGAKSYVDRVERGKQDVHGCTTPLPKVVRP